MAVCYAPGKSPTITVWFSLVELVYRLGQSVLRQPWEKRNSTPPQFDDEDLHSWW